VIIREARIEDAAGIAKVHVDTWRTTYAGILPDEHLANLSYERREKLWIDYILSNAESRIFNYVAENDAGQIVGFASGGPERKNDPDYESELYAIYILKEYQGQGIGHLLTQTLVKRLLQSGMNTMLLWVVSDNPARRFYEALGGQQIKTERAELGGVMINEVAYGWTDINTILQDRYL
jgi:ribosomal protein S18 acetylase RimI-like enzyme